jgi:hypothetical protein
MIGNTSQLEALSIAKTKTDKQTIKRKIDELSEL